MLLPILIVSRWQSRVFNLHIGLYSLTQGGRYFRFHWQSRTIMPVFDVILRILPIRVIQ